MVLFVYTLLHPIKDHVPRADHWPEGERSRARTSGDSSEPRTSRDEALEEINVSC